MHSIPSMHSMGLDQVRRDLGLMQAALSWKLQCSFPCKDDWRETWKLRCSFCCKAILPPLQAGRLNSSQRSGSFNTPTQSVRLQGRVLSFFHCLIHLLGLMSPRPI